MRNPIPILGPSAGKGDVQINPQKTYNLYTKFEGSGAKSPITLRSTEGLVKRGVSGLGGSGRSNGKLFKGREYYVIGQSLVAIDSVNIIYVIGTLSTTSARCQMVAGRNYLMIVDGSYGYTYDGTTFATITDPDFPANPTHCIYIDNFFLVNDAGTDTFYRSDFEDPTSWDALLFEVASASPDNILALATYDRNILAYGSETIQAYFNGGGSGFNFVPYSNTIQMGIAAPHSVAKTPYGVCFLAVSEDGGYGVVKFAGGAQPISNADDHDEIGGLTKVNDAIGMSYTLKGRTFYILTFPTDGVTKAFDLTNNTSFHRKSYQISRWRVNGLGFDGERALGVDYANDKIYELDADVFTEDGEIIERIRDTQIISQSNNRFSVPMLEVDAKAGVGLATGQGSDPVMGLAISRNGGVSYSGFRYKSVGKMGEYELQSVWRELGGQFRSLNTRMIYTEPTDFEIYGAYAEVLG